MSPGTGIRTAVTPPGSRRRLWLSLAGAVLAAGGVGVSMAPVAVAPPVAAAVSPIDAGPRPPVVVDAGPRRPARPPRPEPRPTRPVSVDRPDKPIDAMATPE